MTTLEIPCRPSETSSLLANNIPEMTPLLDLQLRAARRADELARRSLATTPENDRRVWLRAELEIFERLEARQA